MKEEEEEEISGENTNMLGKERSDIWPLLSDQGASTRRPSCSLTFNDSGSGLSNREVIDWRAPSIILGFECLESLALYGICTNLVMYLSDILHQSNTSAAASVTNWTGTSFFTPLLGALFADSYWGSYRTICISSLIYFLGMLIITLSASLSSLKPLPCEGNFCPSASKSQNFVFFSGLYLVAFGSGGVKSSLLPLGAYQFDDDNQVQREKREYFFNCFYFCSTIGSLISSTLIVWVQENISWPIGYGIASLSMGLAIVSFIYGTPRYRLQEPQGSPLEGCFQVMIASLWKFDDSKLNRNGPESNVHADESGFLDKGPTVSYSNVNDGVSQSPTRLCIVSQAEELKLYLRMFPIWVTSIVYSVAFAQMGTTFIEQGKAMCTNIGSFSIPPASLSAFEVLSMLLWALLYDRIFIVTVKRLTQLQRMGVGHFLMLVTMTTAAILEVKRMRGARNGRPVSILWQLLQYFVIGGSEVFCYIGQLEFFYDQGPDSMRSLSTSIALLVISLGSYLSSLLVALVALMTSKGDSPGWIADDLNKGHLDYFFWLLAGLCLLNFVCYLACAKKYTLKRVILKS